MKLSFSVTTDDYLRLPPEFKAKWLDALRSGKYTQGKAYLHCGAAFCCLGVGADIAGAEWMQIGVSDGEAVNATVTTHASGMPHEGDLPLAVWAALKQPTDADQVNTDIEFEMDLDGDDDGDDDGYGVASVMHALAGFNDAGASFEDIAAWIEVNL